MGPVQILKQSGLPEEFSEDKLYRSLCFAGASDLKAKKIVKQVLQKIKPGNSTKYIFNMARKLLRKENHILASHYSLSKSINDLGPDGYLFEKFVCELFIGLGFDASTNLSLKGQCVTHEVDVKAVGEKSTILCECKFHNNVGLKNDLKTALYVYARSLDLRNNTSLKFDEFWLISNTKFSLDAIQYSECVGLKLLGPNYPSRQALTDLAQMARVFPLNCLTNLKKTDTRKLFKEGIYTVNSLVESPLKLKILNFNSTKNDAVLNEAIALLEYANENNISRGN